jgi:DNA-binding transcriptional MerR regulator
VTTTVDLVAITGVSYRRLDFWTRSGYLRPNNPMPGTGTSRDYPPDEVVVARRMARLVDAGIAIPIAARIARGDTTAAAAIQQALEEVPA